MKRLGLYKPKEGWVHIYHEKDGFIYSRRRMGLYIPREDGFIYTRIRLGSYTRRRLGSYIP